MEAVDPSTNQSRGYIRLGAKPRITSLLYTLQTNHPDYQQTIQTIVALSRAANTLEEWLLSLRSEINSQLLTNIILTRSDQQYCVDPCQNGLVKCGDYQEKAVVNLLEEISQLPLFQMLLEQNDGSDVESLNRIVLLLLTMAPDLCPLNANIREIMVKSSSYFQLVSLEIEYLRQQYRNAYFDN
eukprot:TRINITY_DN3365_c0_g1_i1.p2 TRINITY_DN3365_c0_g1~~TRINITY_DN3365_c0_g1_i1.p2  ORF type:complete len:184 (-),score=12.96 TRINITY_DN3365_c0_g1_i1:191-742(-)